MSDARGVFMCAVVFSDDETFGSGEWKMAEEEEDKRIC